MRFAACQLWSVSNAVYRALSWYPGLAPLRLQPRRQLSNGTVANLPPTFNTKIGCKALCALDENRTYSAVRACCRSSL